MTTIASVAVSRGTLRYELWTSGTDAGVAVYRLKDGRPADTLLHQSAAWEYLGTTYVTIGAEGLVPAGTSEDAPEVPADVLAELYAKRPTPKLRLAAASDLADPLPEEEPDHEDAEPIADAAAEDAPAGP